MPWRGQWKSNVKPPWAIDWHSDLWHWMTLNCPRCRSQNLHIKYLECCERYNVGHNGGQIGNHQWVSDWHHHWMTLNKPSSRSIKLHAKYSKNGDRYHDGVNRSQIGNDPGTIDWQHDLWPWMTLNCRSSISLKLHVRYFKNRSRLPPWPLTLDDLEAS